MRLPKLRLPEALFFSLFVLFAFLFVYSICEYWFNPLYTTDDARQQSYPLFRALYPDTFRDDPVTESMMGYLPFLHWVISYVITIFTRSPVMTGHVVMLVQLLLTLFFLYKLIEHLAGRIPAFFSLIWYLHTRNLPMRMTCGLPRGWAGALILIFLYYLVKRRHKTILFVLLLSIFLNPPAAFLCAATYGLTLLYDVAKEKRSSPSWRPLLTFIALSPVFAGVAYLSMKRPPEFGEMVSLAEAEANPAFSRNGGRFAFVPLKSPWDEIQTVGVQAFMNRWDPPPATVRQIVTAGIFLLLIGVFIYELRKKKELIPPEFKIFFFAVFFVYFASRFFAFKLYVPDRHLQFPLNTFWIIAFTIAVWRAFLQDDSLKRSMIALLTLGAFLYAAGGTGLKGEANFNTRTDDRVELYTWIRLNTDRNAVIASHPNIIDGVQLFSMRPGYITSETAHPFYSGYWELAKQRIDTSLRMYYAPDLDTFMNTLDDQEIDYFIFTPRSLQPELLKRARLFKPFDVAIRKLAARAITTNLSTIFQDPRLRSTIAFSDGENVVIDLNELRDIYDASNS